MLKRWKSGKAATMYLLNDGFAIIDTHKQHILYFVRWLSSTQKRVASIEKATQSLLLFANY